MAGYFSCMHPAARTTGSSAARLPATDTCEHLECAPPYLRTMLEQLDVGREQVTEYLAECTARIAARRGPKTGAAIDDEPMRG